MVLKNGREVHIREAEVRDAEKIINYLLANQDRFRYMLRSVDEINTDIDYQKSLIRAHNLRSNSVELVAEYEGKIAGMLDFVGGSWKRTSHAGELGISVDTDVQGIGIGRLMMEMFLDWAEKNPIIEKATLFVMSDNAIASGLYTSLGFEVEGVKKKAVKFPDGKYQDLIMMSRFFKGE